MSGVIGVVETISAVAAEGRAVLVAHGDWMAWNTLLAMVPLFLATRLFRADGKPHTRSARWWLGAAVFVAFLPNAPYVLTDVVHLFADIRTSRHTDLEVLGLVVPLYLAFFAVGFGCYVLSLQRLRLHLAVTAPALPWWIVASALHALCAVGLYLGRVLRFNSWDIVVSPGRLLGTADTLTDAYPLATMLVTFVALVVLTAMFEVLLDATERRVRATVAVGRRAIHRFGLR